MKPVEVFLAEDNDGDVFLVDEALRVSGLEYRLHVAKDGSAVERFLERMGKHPDAPRPDVFLLDLNLPQGDGHEILNSFRAHPACSEVPVIIVTSSDSPKDRLRAEISGATKYFRKPSDLTEFMVLGTLVQEIVQGKPA